MLSTDCKVSATVCDNTELFSLLVPPIENRETTAQVSSELFQLSILPPSMPTTTYYSTKNSVQTLPRKRVGDHTVRFAKDLGDGFCKAWDQFFRSIGAYLNIGLNLEERHILSVALALK